MLRKPLSLLVGITVLGNATVAEVISESRFGLADPVTTITFDELAIADDTRVSAEFAPLGVTFLPELYLRTESNPDWDNITTQNLRSGNLAGDVLHKTFSLSFVPPRSSAAFVAIAQPPALTTFTAKLNGVELESFDANVVIGNVSNYFGFTDIVFDEIEVSYTAETRMRIDTLKLGAAVDVEGPRLNVTASGDNLVFTWESEGGKLYNLRSEIDPSAADPQDWPVFDGKMDIEATPPTNTLTVPRPADPFRLFVVEAFPAPPETVFSDDFESGQGAWASGGDPGPDPGTNWELGAPDPLVNGGPATTNSGTNCWGTNLDASYEVDADIFLRSPPVDLTTAGSATLKYFQFTDIEVMFDLGIVSVLDAADDSELAVLRAVVDGTTAAWEEVSIPLPATAIGKSVRFEFRFQSDNFGNQAGFYLDDFEVTVP